MNVAQRSALVASIIAVIVAGGCTTDYVTGKRTFSLVSESQEIAMGKEADPMIVAQYGLYDDESLAALVNNIGRQTGRVSQRPQLDYTFRVLDSPVINAFALPGGYVYITRGILAHFNSEDELAGVVGHEVGHVVARHGAEQMSRQQLAGLGIGLGSVFSETFAKYADIASGGVGLLFLSFSRDQESESDRLGVEYSTELGYNAHRMADFFNTLKRKGGQAGSTLPGFLSTHPDPGDREVKVDALANEWQGQVAYKPLNTDPNVYLDRIEGLVYGDDPRQGFVEKNVFYHPQLKFQFNVPAGWNLMNTPTMVQLSSDSKDAGIQLTLGKTNDPVAEANNFVANNKATELGRESKMVHGYPAVRLETSLQSEGGELRVLSYFIVKDGSVYDIHGFTVATAYGKYVSTFDGVMGSFMTVTDTAVLNKKPMRVRIKKTSKAGDLRSVLTSFGSDPSMLEDLAILNGRELDERIAAGTRIKTVGQ